MSVFHFLGTCTLGSRKIPGGSVLTRSLLTGSVPIILSVLIIRSVSDLPLLSLLSPNPEVDGALDRVALWLPFIDIVGVDALARPLYRNLGRRFGSQVLNLLVLQPLT
jgi:hypothetical protein